MPLSSQKSPKTLCPTGYAIAAGDKQLGSYAAEKM
jgi:hypothetical protein